MLFAHGQSVPVGRWEMFEQRGKKLVAHGTLLISVTKATEVYAMPKNRILDGQSVGFLSPGRCGMGRGESDRRITKGTLMEVSLVAIAADAGARIIEVKRIDVERVTWRIDELNREWRDENIAQLTQFAGPSMTQSPGSSGWRNARAPQRLTERSTTRSSGWCRLGLPGGLASSEVRPSAQRPARFFPYVRHAAPASRPLEISITGLYRAFASAADRAGCAAHGIRRTRQQSAHLGYKVS
jgi:HK97 family phage prohead protease